MSGCALHGFAPTPGCPRCDDVFDDVVIVAQVRARLAESKGDGLTLEELAADFGIDLDDLDDGRHAIGIEFNADYCKLAAERLSQLSLLAMSPTEGTEP